MLQQAGVVWSGFGAGGTSDPFSITSNATGIEVACNVIGMEQADTFQCFADIQDSDGNWVQAAALTAQTAVGTQTALVSSLAAVTPNYTTVARLRWTTSLGGTTALMVAVGR